jgi:hypothetical protein
MLNRQERQARQEFLFNDALPRSPGGFILKREYLGSNPLLTIK